ncbi:MAG: 1-acyl-sn-glycerol-3-phosphate acyltransferase [Bryobacterales bacterium]|nr:1-acyl-sn-glycerol-3-phosphate acyltransferase [Bryobacterales bacterium]
MSLKRLRGLLITDPFIVLVTILMGSLSLAASLFDPGGRKQHRLARAWGRMILWGAGIRVRAEGLEKIDPGRNYILISNHASYMDIPVLLSCIPAELRFLAKSELFSVPFMGWHLGRAGHVSVPLEDPRASLKTLSEAARVVRDQGISILVFPEAGRQLERLGEFKDGAAYLAIKSGVPVIPMGLARMREVLRMDTLLPASGRVELRVGDPIDTAGWSLKERDALTALFRERIAALLPEEDGGTLDAPAETYRSASQARKRPSG